MKTLKITIATLFSVAILTSCHSEEIVPTSPDRTTIEETRKSDKFEDDEKLNQEKKSGQKTNDYQPVKTEVVNVSEIEG